MQQWNEKRFYSLDFYLKGLFGEKVYRIALDGGMTCPNRDGTLGDRGCIFCSQGGSGEFAGDRTLPISVQFRQGRKLIERKFSGCSYIAYFQAYTNTYAPVSYLRSIFYQAIQEPEVLVLSIATRPDCLEPDVLMLLKELNQVKPVWIELGLQTIHDNTARFIRRGYPLSSFTEAVRLLRAYGIHVIVHTILFLPGESREDMLETIDYLNRLHIQGIKLQLLHVLSGTDLAAYYDETPFPIPSLDEYLSVLGECLAALRPDIVIHRLTGDGPKKLLIAPLWTSDKKRVMNQITKYLIEHDIWQGKNYRKIARREQI